MISLKQKIILSKKGFLWGVLANLVISWVGFFIIYFIKSPIIAYDFLLHLEAPFSLLFSSLNFHGFGTSNPLLVIIPVLLGMIEWGVFGLIVNYYTYSNKIKAEGLKEETKRLATYLYKNRLVFITVWGIVPTVAICFLVFDILQIGHGHLTLPFAPSYSLVIFMGEVLMYIIPDTLPDSIIIFRSLFIGVMFLIMIILQWMLWGLLIEFIRNFIKD